MIKINSKMIKYENKLHENEHHCTNYAEDSLVMLKISIREKLLTIDKKIENIDF